MASNRRPVPATIGLDYTFDMAPRPRPAARARERPPLPAGHAPLARETATGRRLTRLSFASLLAAAVLALCAGCASTRVSRVGPPYPTRTIPERIALVESTGGIPEFVVIATIEVPNNAYRSAGAAVNEMKEEASGLGADALLDVTWGGRSTSYVVTPTGSGFGTLSGSRLVGTAIRWRNEDQARAWLAARRAPGL